MTSSTIKKWWPVTYEYGLIKASVGPVTIARAAMFRAHGIDVDVIDLKGRLEALFHALEPLSPAPTKEMYLSTNFGWTVFLRNGTQGSDPFEPMMKLSRALGVTAMRVCVTPPQAAYKGVIWEVYDRPEAGGDKHGYRRSIAAVNDGGKWVFHQSGEPYFFEDTEAYRARLKKDRFTGEMLYRYLENFAVRPLSDDVFDVGDDAKNMLIGRPVHESLPAMTLNEFLRDKS